MSRAESRNTAWNLVLGYGQPSRRRRIVTIIIAVLIVLLFPTVFLLNYVRQSRADHALMTKRIAAFEQSVERPPHPPLAEVDLVNLFRDVTPGENWELQISDEAGNPLATVRRHHGLPERPIGLKTNHKVTLFGRPLLISRTDRFGFIDLVSGPQVLLPLLITLIPLLIMAGYFRRRGSFSIGEKMLDTLADVIMVVDRELRVVYVSPSMQKRFDTPASNIQGRPFLGLFDGRDRQEVQAALDMATDSDHTQPHTARLARDDGAVFEVEVAVRRMIAEKKDLGFLVTLHDVSELLQLSRQVEQNARVESLGRVAATIAHEFNNVLAGLQVSLDILNRKAGDEPAVRSLSEMMRRHVAVGKHIAEAVLRFSRPAEIHSEALDVKSWIENVAADLDASLRRSARLVLNIEAGDVAIHGDMTQLTQVITNLVLNARDASRPGEEIRIDVLKSQGGRWAFGVVPAGDYVHIIVSDEGSGISPAVMGRIFEPLFTTKQRGTGLGLSVCHQIITAHHGQIFVSSEKGKGTQFHLFLRSIAEPAMAPGVVAYDRDQALM